ncbi:MAG: EamA/RhaT family transporter [Bacteroidetes bacterium]|nr:MAG: EamA/RhaT family transporter [Bacteroidota bacterium]
MTKKKRAYIELHIAIVLFGLTAILGKLITLDAVPLVWWRVLITSISLFFILGIRQTFRNLPLRLILKFLLTGALLAIHWITFFLSIKLANVSIALMAFATQSFFTAIFEPLIVGGRIRRHELAVGFLIVPAMILIVSDLDLSLRLGLWVGILSSVVYAIFASASKRLIDEASPVQISFFQLFGCWLFVTMLLPFMVDFEVDQFVPVGPDLIYMIILTLLCTSLAYVLSMRALRYISAFDSNLAINLEPIYGIVLAWLLFNENKELTLSFYLGGAIIIATVVLYPVISRRNKKPELNERPST